LLVLVEAESLFKDGTAAVAFGVVVAMASGQQLTSLEITAVLLKTIGGGVLCGAAVALGALLLAGRTDDLRNARRSLPSASPSSRFRSSLKA
jgi:CPA1 family monovalent cation:H+ antiporter